MRICLQVADDVLRKQGRVFGIIGKPHQIEPPEIGRQFRLIPEKQDRLALRLGVAYFVEDVVAVRCYVRDDRFCAVDQPMYLRQQVLPGKDVVSTQTRHVQIMVDDVLQAMEQRIFFAVPELHDDEYVRTPARPALNQLADGWRWHGDPRLRKREELF